MRIPLLALNLVAALSLALLSACSIAPYEGRYRYEDGWRKARVQTLGTLERLESKYGYTCPLANKVEKTTPVAIVGYQGTGHWRTQLMLLSGETVQEKSDKVGFSVDDLVYANIKQCAEPMIPR